jgi:tripartite-type tricarboxylate transporter receptor subunit TctC
MTKKTHRLWGPVSATWQKSGNAGSHMTYLKAPALTALLALAATPLAAQPAVESFYKGKTIDFIIGYSPGGGYDAYARLVARHMGQYVPGTPNMIARNMPGGGSRVAAAYVAKIAPKDGTVLATADQSLSLQQAIGDKAITFDTQKFIYIGNPSQENNTTVTWYTSGIKTIEDATKQEVPMGATGGSTSSQFPRAMNSLLGTKFKIILGYPGGNDINLAMEKGEVAGRGSNSWAAWKATRPDWLEQKKINILVQIGLEKAPDLPNVPLLIDLAKNEEDRGILKLLSASTTIGRPIFTTPGVPEDRVKALRAAFDKLLVDPSFLAEARKENFDITAVSGESLQKIVAEIVATPKPVADRLQQIIGGIEENTGR